MFRNHIAYKPNYSYNPDSYNGLDSLHFHVISAYAFIDPEISEICTNGLDNDGDALIDIENTEDFLIAPGYLDSSPGSISSNFTYNSKPIQSKLS
jgi:hypothetical protein